VGTPTRGDVFRCWKDWTCPVCLLESPKTWRQGEVITSVTITSALGRTTPMFVTVNLKK
jgi:hypothetical protein